VLNNGGFERSAKGDWFAGWDQVGVTRARMERPGRPTMRRSTAGRQACGWRGADDDIVQVSAERAGHRAGNGFAVGRTYRLGAWLKPVCWRGGAINFAFFGPR